MTARIIDGKAMAAHIRGEVAERVRELTGRGVTPGLAAVLVGDDPASKVYVGAKQKACAEVGIHSERHDLPGDVPESELLELVTALNEDPDVDGLTPASVGRLVRGDPMFSPATPLGIIEMLARTGIPTEGRDAVVVGRGALVGMPLSIMLAQKSPRANATVTLCHTGTRDLGDHTRRGDIVVVASGKPNTLTGDMVKPGAAVIDVGINRTDDNTLVGDVAFDEVAEVAGWITPVPGGVGPLTVAMLLVNTVAAAETAARGA